MKRVQFEGVTHSFPDDFTDAEIADALSTSASPGTTRVGAEPTTNYNRDWLREGLALLPMAGGVAGGLVGGAGGTVAGFGVGGVPGSIGGAAAGGAGGEALRQNLSRLFGLDAPETATDALRGIGIEAGKQGAYEAGGRALSGGVKLLGKGLMKAALRPTPTLKGRFPEVLNTALGEGRIPVKEAARGGLERAMEINRSRLSGMGKEMNRALDKALADGNWYTPDEFLSTVNNELRTTVKDNPLRVRYMKELRQMVKEYRFGRRGPMVPATPASTLLGENGQPLIPEIPSRPLFPTGEPMSPADVRAMKRSAQETAAPIYNAQARGSDPGGVRQLEGRFQRGVATDSRRALAGLPTETQGQNVAALDDRMRNLIGLEQALLEASNRHYGSGLPMLPPALNWAMPAGIRSPRTLYPAALSVTDPKVLAAVAQLPRTPETLLRLLAMLPNSIEPDSSWASGR